MGKANTKHWESGPLIHTHSQRVNKNKLLISFVVLEMALRE